jgi:hypothetical protein
VLDGLVFPLVSEENNLMLAAIFSLDEITTVVRSMDGSKCPGPDGFIFNFIKEFWWLIRHDVRILFDQFYGNECIPQCLLAYFLTLVPKTKSPQCLGDFRPISLLGCIYKLLAKVLAARLTSVMDPLISESQSAFLKGRQLVEGVVVMNEVIDFAKRRGKECIILKVDFEKAYDSVDWGFVDYMLLRFGFCDKWRAWMRACICAGNMSVLINGSPTGEINIKRGLKQGDPLAPLLFLLVAEGLGLIMRRAVELNLFRPFLLGREEVPISILQYADDTLCIGEACIENLWLLKAMLRGFEMASGLKVNFSKSCLIGINVGDEFMNMGTDFLNCKRGVTLFKYLGLPAEANPRKVATWEPMLKVIRGRLGSWGNKHISLGGRIVMINAVLSAIPVFFLSYMKMPLKVWREVVKIQRTFLWGGLSKRSKTCWVCWEDICKPKKEGGLGIRDLRLVNISLLAKWRWKLLSCDRTLWKDAIIAKYGSEIVGVGNLGASQIHRDASIWWRDICSLDKNNNWFAEVVEKRVGNGNLTSFWGDVWVGNQSLQNYFPRIFSISNQQRATISSMGEWVGGGWRWVLSWRREFFDWEVPIYREFMDHIQQFVPSVREVTWVWCDDRADGFSVKSCYFMLLRKFREQRLLDPCTMFAVSKIWSCGIPSKISAFSWQLLLNRIPTKENLCKRGIIPQHQSVCIFCNGSLESAVHLFLHCDTAAKVWYEIMSWLGLVIIVPLNIASAFACLVEHGKGKKEKVCLSLIWNSYMWSMWKFRNDCIFNNKNVVIGEVVDHVKFQSWKWFVGKVAKSPCLLYEWQWSPMDCFKR